MLRRLLAPLALAASVACTVVPAAHERATATAPETTSVEPHSAETAEVIERMLALTVAGQTLGVVETRLEKHPDGGVTMTEHTTVSMVRQGGGPEAQFDTETEEITVYDANNQLVSDHTIEREAGIVITRSLTIEGDEIVSNYSGPGRPEEIKRFELPPDYRESRAVELELIGRWRETGEPATIAYSTFNADSERFEHSEVTITGETVFAHGGEQIPAYVFRVVEEDGTVVDAIVDHDLMALKVSAAGTFVASLVDERPALGAGGNRINSEIPVSGRTSPDWTELAEQAVTVRVAGDDPEAPPLWTTNHYHRVERDGESYAMTLLNTRPDAGFVAPTLPLDIDDPAIRRYLDPTVSAQSDDPALIAAAARVVEGETDALVAASRIVEAVFESLDKRAGVRGSATATEVLTNGAGDCTEHAVLVVALMRAAGIPARTVDGIVLASGPGGDGVSGYHAWAEIWLGQWIGVDATVNETGTSARYLLFGIDEPGELSSGGKLMRTIGKTSIALGPHTTF